MRQIHMDTLPRELLNVIVGGDLVVYDRFRATSRAIAAHLEEPPILADGVPVGGMARGIHVNGRRILNISRGNLSSELYVTSVSDVLVVGCGQLRAAVRIFRGYDGPAPIFVRVERSQPGTKQPRVSNSTDARHVMVAFNERVYCHFDIDIMNDCVYVQISNLKKVLDSGKWRL